MLFKLSLITFSLFVFSLASFSAEPVFDHRKEKLSPGEARPEVSSSLNPQPAGESATKPDLAAALKTPKSTSAFLENNDGVASALDEMDLSSDKLTYASIKSALEASGVETLNAQSFAKSPPVGAPGSDRAEAPEELTNYLRSLRGSNGKPNLTEQNLRTFFMQSPYGEGKKETKRKKYFVQKHAFRLAICKPRGPFRFGLCHRGS